MLSILVKDMLLPKSCYECPLNTGEYSPAEYEKRYCAITDRSMYLSDYKKRPSDCPLVELPEEHGDLIDRQLLKQNVLKWMPNDPCGIEEHERPFETDICVSMMMEIEEQPTVIEAEGSE